VDKSEIVPSVDLIATKSGSETAARLNYAVTTKKDAIKLSFKTFAGPKGHEILAQVDPALTDLVNFGMFSPIGKILLVVLKFFNQIVGNWGVSIILLTLVVRLLVLPVNITSFKSMKRMKVIQPMMQALREKYKDEPATLQRETMALMKREKVNPLGGCLPMLLQMPIFFALFQVLGHSIELYQAPFFGWIGDLSLKDPYYVLPVLIGIVFFIQQKITPSTMDPAQAKVMQFMPIMFAFMMLSLPSGLTLYTFVSTLFGITQQRIFMRDRNPVRDLKPAT
jgi:YidC/Oxa1 family membrane protein insertase